jgi:uncharacterized protein
MALVDRNVLFYDWRNRRRKSTHTYPALTMKDSTVINKEIVNTDYEIRSLDVDQPNEVKRGRGVTYLLAGILFGIILVKGEIVSWFRIQEMFRFQSFHMYGVIGSAVLVGGVSVWLIRKFNVRSMNGEPISIATRKFSKGNIYGGLLFGFGWALTGACPGPLFALMGTGAYAMVVVFLSALAGTWVYGLLSDKLPR